jgi:hypothetical protein
MIVRLRDIPQNSFAAAAHEKADQNVKPEKPLKKGRGLV